VVAALVVRSVVSEEIGRSCGRSTQSLPTFVLSDVRTEDARFEGILVSFSLLLGAFVTKGL